MKLTKYSHACFVLEENGERLVVDPGNFTHDFEMPSGVVAVVVTHIHPDHCDPETLRAIVAANPGTKIYALAEVAQAASVSVSVIEPGQQISVGDFHLEFIGGKHATIHDDMDTVGNVGIVVNHDVLYYPGDSFTLPPRHMRSIATPVAAPWLKISETVDFLRNAKPTHAFPTHDAILSDVGKTLVDRVITNLIPDTISYRRVVSGEIIEL